jgi:hypothetical protein
MAPRTDEYAECWRNNRRWCVVGSWISLALLACIASNTWSGESVLLLAMMGLLPPIIMLALWKQPSRTIAVVIRATEERG